MQDIPLSPRKWYRCKNNKKIIRKIYSPPQEPRRRKSVTQVKNLIFWGRPPGWKKNLHSRMLFWFDGGQQQKRLWSFWAGGEKKCLDRRATLGFPKRLFYENRNVIRRRHLTRGVGICFFLRRRQTDKSPNCHRRGFLYSYSSIFFRESVCSRGGHYYSFASAPAPKMPPRRLRMTQNDEDLLKKLATKPRREKRVRGGGGG